MNEKDSKVNAPETEDVAMPTGASASVAPTPKTAKSIKRVDEEDIETAERETMEGFRIVKIESKDGSRAVKFIRPRPATDAAANLVYARAVARLSADGDILFEGEMLQRLEARGVWTGKEDALVGSYQDDEYDAARDIEKLISDMVSLDSHGGGARRKMQKAVDRLEKKREEAFNKRQALEEKKSRYLSATVEYLAGLERQNSLVRHCILDPETNRPLWETDKAWEDAAEEDPLLFSASILNVMAFWGDMPGTAPKDAEAF